MGNVGEWGGGSGDPVEMFEHRKGWCDDQVLLDEIRSLVFAEPAQ